jgi:hypothetical protein
MLNGMNIRIIKTGLFPMTIKCINAFLPCEDGVDSILFSEFAKFHLFSVIV